MRRLWSIPGLLALVFVLTLGPGPVRVASAQGPPPPPPLQGPPVKPPPGPPPPPPIIRVFLDCPDGDCDYDFLRSEITFVNIVRDRKDADVHVLVTSQLTGGGGWDCTIAFIGQNAFEKIDRVVHYVTKTTDTRDETRKGLARTLKMGLVQYVADTPVASEIEVIHRRPAARPQDASRGARDPWDSWLIRTSLRSSSSGEASRSSLSLSGSFSANRVTEAWKITNSLSVSYSQSDYTFSEGDTYTSISRSASAGSAIVKSLGPHWATGMRLSLSSSTYLNQRLTFRAAPAVEYNVFPYADSTRRLLTFNYSLGINSYSYHDETIFSRTRETRPDQKLLVSFDAKQPWGTLSSSFEVSEYLHDLAKHRLVFYSGADVRVFRGFSFNVYGSVSRIRDQLYLSKGEATPEEVLVRQRQLATSYQYYFSIGLSYSFGSIFNNVVNPRFGGSSGGMIIYY